MDYLKGTINSVLNQDYNNIEIIISDDSSEDFDYNSIKKLFSKASVNLRKLIIHSNCENLGTVKNFNNAIKMSNGNLIIPLSCGDEFENNSIISLIKSFFNENSYLVCTGKRRLVDEFGNKISVLPSKKDISILVSGKSKLEKRMYMGNFIYGACTYYRRDVFDKYGLFDEEFKLLEDYPFYLKILHYGESIGLINEITIRYRIGGVSSGKKHPLLIEDDKRVYEKILFPMKYKLGYVTYRRLRFIYYRKYFKENKRISRVAVIKYIDIAFLNVMIKIIMKIKDIINIDMHIKLIKKFMIFK